MREALAGATSARSIFWPLTLHMVVQTTAGSSMQLLNYRQKLSSKLTIKRSTRLALRLRLISASQKFPTGKETIRPAPMRKWTSLSGIITQTQKRITMLKTLAMKCQKSSVNNDTITMVNQQTFQPTAGK